jgi:uncharacterized membrane protein YcaP (DUF421 family)
MEIVVRATVIFFFLFLLMRGLGRRELSEMSAFELVVLVTLGDLVQQGITQEDMSLTGAMLAAGTMGMWAFVLSYASFRSGRMKRLLAGVPVVIARDGKILEEVAKLERLTVDDILDEARQNGIADVDEIALAILEIDGNFSFIKKDSEQHPGSKNRDV